MDRLASSGNPELAASGSSLSVPTRDAFGTGHTTSKGIVFTVAASSLPAKFTTGGSSNAALVSNEGLVGSSKFGDDVLSFPKALGRELLPDKAFLLPPDRGIWGFGSGRTLLGPFVSSSCMIGDSVLLFVTGASRVGSYSERTTLLVAFPSFPGGVVSLFDTEARPLCLFFLGCGKSMGYPLDQLTERPTMMP